MWSNEIKCTTTGIHSVALPTNNDTPGNARAIAVEISDAVPGTLSISIRATTPGLAVLNNAPAISKVYVETDSPEKEQGNTKASKPAGPPPHCFVALQNDSAPCGWFRPFAKHAETTKVKLYLTHTDSTKIPAPIEVNLYDWSVYAIFKPRGAAIATTVTCIRKSQHSQTVQIEVVELKAYHEIVFSQEEVKGVCSECGHCIKRKTLLDSLKEGVVKCDSCGALLQIPQQGQHTSIRDKGVSVLQGVHAAKSFARASVDKMEDHEGPIATFMSIKRWIAWTALTVTLDVPNVGISIMSKRNRQELLYVNVEGVYAMVEAPEGALHTHTYDLEVSEVRIDHQMGRDDQRPAIVSSTVVLDPKGKNTRNEQQQPPALSVSIVRPFVTAPALCLKILQCKLEQRWEVVADTSLVNEIFEFAAECLQIIGPIRLLNPEHLVHEFQSASGTPKVKTKDPQRKSAKSFQKKEKSPSKTQVLINKGEAPSRAIMDMIEEDAELLPEFFPPRAPLILQTDHLTISAIEAKLWTSLRLDQMTFVPMAIARTIQFITMSSSVELTAALVHLTPQELPPSRSSARELLMTFIKIYTPQLIKTATRILGSSNLGGIVAVPFKVVRGAATIVSDTALSAVTLGHRDKAKANIRRKLGMSPVTEGDATIPALQGAPRQRLPRLLQANARLVSYDRLQAEIMQKLGTELSYDLLYS
jgi:hypothetical protein